MGELIDDEMIAELAAMAREHADRNIAYFTALRAENDLLKVCCVVWLVVFPWENYVFIDVLN